MQRPRLKRVFRGDPLDVLDLRPQTAESLTIANIATVGRLAEWAERNALRYFNAPIQRDIQAALEKVQIAAEIGVSSSKQRNYIPSLDDPVAFLGFATRNTYNALISYAILTVGDLLDAVRNHSLDEMSNLGPQSMQEIQDRINALDLWSLLPAQPGEDGDSPPAETDGQLPAATRKTLKQYIDMYQAQVRAGLVHPDATYQDNRLDDIFSLQLPLDIEQVGSFALQIFGDTPSIASELLTLLRLSMERDLQVILDRFGLYHHTLELIGQRNTITRERVRQICQRYQNRIVRSFTRGDANSIHTRSAILIIQNSREKLTLAEWRDYFIETGMLGPWPEHAVFDIDPFDVFIAAVQMVWWNDATQGMIPRALQVAIRQAREPKIPVPSKSAPVVEEVMPRTARKTIRRHTNFTGAVSEPWLIDQLGAPWYKVEAWFTTLGYELISEDGDWYMPATVPAGYKIDLQDVFHHAIRKMLQFCPPLDLQQIHEGLGAVLERSEFPLPPVKVLGVILDRYHYHSQDGLYTWDGPRSERLSPGETAMYAAFNDRARVLNHSEITRAFSKHGLAYSSLQGTLGRSPLFRRIDQGFYKLRGTQTTREDKQRARNTMEKVSLGLEVAQDRSGRTVISANLSHMAVGTGTIQINTPEFPDLTGEWACIVNGERMGTMGAAVTGLRRMKRQFTALGCDVGDRIRFTFDPRDQTVVIEKV
jgi:hypothetical protein